MQRRWLKRLAVTSLVALAGACGSVSNSSDGGGGGAGSGPASGSGGSTGPTGAAGHAGNGGAAGAAGDTGTAGQGGSSGVTGGAGASGNAGHGGTTGAGGANPTGAAGASGHGGTAGAAGASGHAGTAGVAGAAGHGGMGGVAGSAGHGGVAGAAGSGGHGGAGGNTVCSDIEAEYATALKAAQMCTVGASSQCAVQVAGGFFCGCTTFANGGQDTLAAIAAQFQASGCRDFCTGTCGILLPAACVADATSTTGGRCQPVGLLNLDASSSGSSFAATVGEEVDITLTHVGPGNYTLDPVLSSPIMTVLQITIPAGPPNPGGPAQLYRLRATAAGQVRIEIPFEAAGGGPSRPTFVVTITIN